MTTPAVERRRLALLTDSGRFDFALPIDDLLGDALRSGGLPVGDGRHVVLDHDGTEISPETAAIDLVDGGLYSLVDLSAGRAARVTPDGREERAHRGSAWWLLAPIAPIAVIAALTGASDSAIRPIASVVLGVGALIAAFRWVIRGRTALAGTFALLASVVLAFAAGALIVPPGLDGSVRLAVVTGFVAAAVLSAVLTALAKSADLRAAAGTVTIFAAVLAGIWGVVLLVQWPGAAAAAICAGAVPLALRALPSTLVNLPEGYFINYRHFMAHRWTVRGAIPVSPDTIRVDVVRSVVDGSSARLVVGTAVISLVAAVFAPVAVLQPWGEDPFVVVGGIALLGCLEVSLLLTPRHTTGTLLRWMPRVAAAVVLVAWTWLIITMLDPFTLALAAAGLFFAAVVSAMIVVPVARGISSLAWSRVGDAIEWLAVALALPAALLYANVLDLLRGMMAG